MRRVDAAGNRVDISVLGTLRLIKASAAGEHHICPLEQATLERDKSRRSAAKGRELVHIVVNTDFGPEMKREGKRHGRVVPEGQLAIRTAAQCIVYQLALQKSGGRRRASLGKHGNTHVNAGRFDPPIDPRLRLRIENGLFDKQYVIIRRGTRQEMLRALPDEIPAQMR